MVYRSIAKDSAVYGGADLMGRLVSLLVFPLVARVLGPDGYGALELLLTSVAIIGTIAGCGLNNSTQRYYWDGDTLPPQRPIIVSTGLLTLIGFVLVGVLLGSVLGFAMLAGNAGSTSLITIGGVLAALVIMSTTQVTQYALDVIRLHFKPWRFLSVTTLSRVGATLLGAAAVVVWGWGITGMLTLQAAVTLLVVPIALALIRRDLVLRFDRAWAQRLVRFGYPFILAGLGLWLFGTLDRWMLAWLDGIDEVGVYSVAFRLATVVFFVSGAFAQAWSPLAIKIKSDHPETYRTIYGNVLSLLLWVMLAVGGGVILFAPNIIRLLFQPDYWGAAPSLVLLACAAVLQSAQQVTALGITLEAKTVLFGRMTWAMVGLNGLLNLALIPLFGASGSAAATLISYAFLSAGYLYFTQRLHPIVLHVRSLIAVLVALAILTVIGLALVDAEPTPATLSLRAVLLLAVLAATYALLPVRRLRIRR